MSHETSNDDLSAATSPHETAADMGYTVSLCIDKEHKARMPPTHATPRETAEWLRLEMLWSTTEIVPDTDASWFDMENEAPLLRHRDTGAVFAMVEIATDLIVEGRRAGSDDQSERSLLAELLAEQRTTNRLLESIAQSSVDRRTLIGR